MPCTASRTRWTSRSTVLLPARLSVPSTSTAGRSYGRTPARRARWGYSGNLRLERFPRCFCISRRQLALRWSTWPGNMAEHHQPRRILGEEPRPIAEYQVSSGHIGYAFAQPLMQEHTPSPFSAIRRSVSVPLLFPPEAQPRRVRDLQTGSRAEPFQISSRPGFQTPAPGCTYGIISGVADHHGYTHLDDRTVDSFSEQELLHLPSHVSASFRMWALPNRADSRKISRALGLPRPRRKSRH